jgi:hypothetical protein
MRRSTLLIAVTVGFTVLYAASTIALGTPPAADDSGATVAAWFRDNDGHVRVWLWLLTLGLPLFATYAALVRERLPAPHRDVFFVGAIAFIAETAVQGWVWGGLALHAGSLSAANARLLADVAGYWGPVLTSTTIAMLAPVAVAVLSGRVALPRWLGLLAALAALEQLVETVTVFGHKGFLAPGGALNVYVGAGITAVALIALGLTAARATTITDPAAA